MKGVILAGGLGTRMHPLTRITNKHLLPVYDKPMIYYSISALVNAGVKDIMIVTGGAYAGEFLRLLKNGQEFGLKRISYAYQEGEGGIADALKLTEDFVAGNKVIVLLADNIIGGTIKPAVESFRRQKRGAKIILKEVQDPRSYGCPVLKGSHITRIEEKPKKPKSPYAVTGIYMYDPSVFEIAEKLRPSARGELEITDVNNAYIRRGTMTYEILEGWWGDAGESIDAYLRVNRMVAEYGANKAK